MRDERAMAAYETQLAFDEWWKTLKPEQRQDKRSMFVGFVAGTSYGIKKAQEILKETV